MTTIDRDRFRRRAEYGYTAIVHPDEMTALLDALEQAEAERHTYRAKMDELDRAYISEHGQRKRIERQVRDVKDAAPTIPAGNDDHAWRIMTDLDAGAMFAWENVLDILNGD